MAEFDKGGEHLSLFRERINLKCSGDESAAADVVHSSSSSSLTDDVYTVDGLNDEHSHSRELMESSDLTAELDNDILSQTDYVDEMGEESPCKNNDSLRVLRLNNNVEIEEDLKKKTLTLDTFSLPSSNCSIITSNNRHGDDTDTREDVSDGSNISQFSYGNGTGHVVPDSDTFTKTYDRKKKEVSFPKDTLISGYLDPPDPWKNAPTWTTDELVSAYKNSCDLNGTKPIAKLIQQLSAMNSENKREELLSLKGERLDQKQCECLEEILKRAQFKMLDLEACHLDDESAVALFDMIEFYESACQLNIAFNKNIQARGWQACSKLVRRAPSITFLDLRNCDLNDRTIPIFGRALKLGCHLTILHMENMNLSGRPLLIFVAAIKTNEILQELFLAENKLTPTDGVHLGNLLHHNHKLRLLDLRNNHLQDVGTGHICDGLMEQTKGSGLRTLVLWNNSVTYQAMSTLGKALAASQNLETLNIGHNGITNEGAHQLKYGLLRLNCLLRLGLQGCRISDEGAVALAEYIADTKVLLRIDLRNNDIKTAGLMALSHAMRVNTSVTRIDLDKEAKKEPGIKDYIEQQGRLIGDILTFQQRNVQIVVKKEEQERMLLKEKAESEITAAEKGSESEQQSAGTLPANSSTESFTLIEDVLEKVVGQEIGRNDTDIFVAENHLEQVSSEENSIVDVLNYSPEDKRPQHRPNVLFPFEELSRQTSLDSPAPTSNDDDFAVTVSDSLYECVSPSGHSSQANSTAITGAAPPAEMILSPQYFPKQIARKIFSVVRVNEDSSCPQLSSSTTSSHLVSYDPLSVSTVPLVPVSSSLPYSPPTSELQHAIGVVQHSKCVPQATSPSSLLLQDLAKETIRHMVSPDVDMDVKILLTGNPGPDTSHKTVDKDSDINKDCENTLEPSNTGLKLANYLHSATLGQTPPVSTSEADDDLESLLTEPESEPVSTLSFKKYFGVVVSENETSVVSYPSIVEGKGVVMLEDSALSQQESTSEEVQEASQEFEQTNINIGHEMNLEHDFVDDIFKEVSETVTNNTEIDCVKHVPETSESDTDFADSNNETAAFLDLEADGDGSSHCQGINANDELFHQCHHDELAVSSQRVFLADEKPSLSTVTDLYRSEEPASICLNNYNSPALLLSQELSSDSLQEKSVISQFAPTNTEEHSFSSIVDLLRLDMCEISDRKDMQIDEAVVKVPPTCEDLVNDNIDIENVDFSIDEEPWLTVGVETDGNDAEACKKSLKQPDFFTTLSMNGLTQELASALTSLDGSSGPFDGEDYDLDS